MFAFFGRLKNGLMMTVFSMVKRPHCKYSRSHVECCNLFCYIHHCSKSAKGWLIEDSFIEKRVAKYYVIPYLEFEIVNIISIIS